MDTVRLGFKAFDIHELLCHCVARDTGLYAEHDLRVELVDTTFNADTDLDPRMALVACGAALAAWLRGAPMKVLFVATDRPLFWLYARAGIADFDALRGSTIAGYPAIAPPAQLLKVVLAGAGLQADRDLRIVPARDDLARVGLLGLGDVAAAVVSSAIVPAEMIALGFRPLAFFGDRIRVPTTGLAVTQQFIDAQPRVARALVGALQSALARIHRDTPCVREVLTRRFRVAPACVDPTVNLIRACFTPAGMTTRAIAQGAVDAMARALSIAPVPDAAGLYESLEA